MRELRCHSNPSTSTQLDVATWWKHGGEFRVQFERKVFEISGGLSAKHIQHLSVHQTKPRRTEGKNIQKQIIETPNVDTLKRHNLVLFFNISIMWCVEHTNIPALRQTQEELPVSRSQVLDFHHSLQNISVAMFQCCFLPIKNGSRTQWRDVCNAADLK